MPKYWVKLFLVRMYIFTDHETRYLSRIRLPLMRKTETTRRIAQQGECNVFAQAYSEKN